MSILDVIALSNNDYKKLQTFDKITSYLYGTNTFKYMRNRNPKNIND